METMILESKKIDGLSMADVSCGKHRALVSHSSKSGLVSVYVSTTRPGLRLGKHFHSFEAAASNYKLSEIKEIIRTAEEFSK